MSVRTMYTGLGREVRVYPNVIEVWQDGAKLAGFTPEEWAQMVQFVGIAGVHPEPETTAMGSKAGSKSAH